MSCFGWFATEENAGCSFFATDITSQRWFWLLPPFVCPDCVGLSSWRWFSGGSLVAQGYTWWLSVHPQLQRGSGLICPVCLWFCQGCHPMIGLSSPTCPARQWVVLLSACGRYCFVLSHDYKSKSCNVTSANYAMKVPADLKPSACLDANSCKQTREVCVHVQLWWSCWVVGLELLSRFLSAKSKLFFPLDCSLALLSNLLPKLPAYLTPGPRMWVEDAQKYYSMKAIGACILLTRGTVTWPFAFERAKARLFVRGS